MSTPSTDPPSTTPQPFRCQRLDIALCVDALPHNVTSYPNLLGHQDAQQARTDLQAFRYSWV